MFGLSDIVLSWSWRNFEHPHAIESHPSGKTVLFSRLGDTGSAADGPLEQQRLLNHELKGDFDGEEG